MSAGARLLAGALAVLLAAASPAATGKRGRIVGLHARGDAEVAVVEVQGDRPLSFTTLRLSGPPRVVLDFADTEIAGVPREQEIEDGTVRRIGAAPAGARTARVVIELAGEAEFDVRAHGARLDVRVTRLAPLLARLEPGRKTPPAAAPVPAPAARRAPQEPAAGPAVPASAGAVAALDPAPQAAPPAPPPPALPAAPHASAAAPGPRPEPPAAAAGPAAPLGEGALAAGGPTPLPPFAEPARPAGAEPALPSPAGESVRPQPMDVLPPPLAGSARPAPAEQAAALPPPASPPAAAGAQAAASARPAAAAAAPPAPSPAEPPDTAPPGAQAAAAAAPDQPPAPPRVEEDPRRSLPTVALAGAGQRPRAPEAGGPAAPPSAAPSRPPAPHAAATPQPIAVASASASRPAPHPIALAPPPAHRAAAAALAAAAHGGAAPAPGQAAITGIGFRPGGGGAVIVRSDRPLDYGVSGEDHAVLLHLRGAAIKRPNDRLPLDTRFFGGPVERVVPLAVAGGVDLRIELRARADYQLQQGDGVLSLVFSAP